MTTVTIDLKDRKILYELDLNCRQSNTQVGKKVGLKKDVVTYRIKQMEQAGIINGYWTEINTLNLGYDVYRLYINFQDTNTAIKKEIIDYFAQCKDAWAVLSVKGPIDLDIMMWVGDSQKFQTYWNNTLDKYGKYFLKNTISILTGGIGFKKSYLLPETDQGSDRKYFVLRKFGKTINIDEIDYQILNELSTNARISLIDLASKLNCSSQTVKYRIKNLIEKGIILALRVNINSDKIGLKNSTIDIYLKDYTKKKKILDYIEKLPNVEYIVESTGWCDIQLEIWVKDVEQIMQVIDDIDSRFPDTIRKQDFWMTKKYHRLRMIPEMSKADFKS